ncbi:MAG TPA: YggS family pyridoxal phosphate-dependent enzyme [Acetobacteraceae bacterium]|nr:YggS family pyridoxal phosphate-dependent enzyme [Acetobacteraceae bacterium]
MPDSPNTRTIAADPEGIAARLADVRRRIAEAARRAGRDPAQVRLIAVSKTKPAASVAAACAAGQAEFGENRVQEALAKFTALKPASPGLVLHLIGGLQTNKAREAVRLADVIHTLDRPRLADALAAAMAREGCRPRLLIEINTGAEPQKSGIPRDEADAFIDRCRARFGGLVIGLMCIPPLADDPRPHFEWLAACARRHGLRELSMGMSADFEAAIACGATMVRVGTAIFGAR